MSEWQDIETAPKDGRWILAVVSGFIPDVVHWDGHYGWWTGQDDFIEGECDEMWRPTHWQPLPPPPVKSGSPAANE